MLFMPFRALQASAFLTLISCSVELTQEPRYLKSLTSFSAFPLVVLRGGWFVRMLYELPQSIFSSAWAQPWNIPPPLCSRVPEPSPPGRISDVVGIIPVCQLNRLTSTANSLNRWSPATLFFFSSLSNESFLFIFICQILCNTQCLHIFLQTATVFKVQNKTWQVTLSMKLN